jgi:hypothetical protein
MNNFENYSHDIREHFSDLFSELIANEFIRYYDRVNFIARIRAIFKRI